MTEMWSTIWNQCLQQGLVLADRFSMPPTLSYANIDAKHTNQENEGVAADNVNAYVIIY